MTIHKTSPISYHDKLAQADREAAMTLVAALLVTAFFWLVIYFTKESQIFCFGLPLWFWLSCIGGYFLSIIAVVILVKCGFKNFDLVSKAEKDEEM